MTTQNSAMGDEELDQALIDIFAEMARSYDEATIWTQRKKVLELIKSRDQQIALAARSGEYQRGRNSVGGESINEAWERGRRVGMRAFELGSNSEYFKTREGIIETLCMTLWQKSWGEVKGNERRFECIMGFMRQFDAYVDKRIEESYKPATLKQAQNKEIKE